LRPLRALCRNRSFLCWNARLRFVGMVLTSVKGRSEYAFARVRVGMFLAFSQLASMTTAGTKER
jgi:hypothetical protein